MDEKVIIARFGKTKVAQTEKQWRYNHGQKLKFEGVDLPANYEVHFSNSKTGEAKTVIGNADGALIPHEYFVPGSMIYAWAYVEEDGTGITKREVRIPIDQKARPTDQQPLPEEQTVVEQAIEALNAAVEEIPTDIAAALAEAKASGLYDGTNIWWTYERISSGAPGYDGGVRKRDLNGKDGETPLVGDLVYGPAVRSDDVITDLYVIANINGPLVYLAHLDRIVGDDGFSPEVEIEQITNGHRVTITDAEGPKSFDVMNGEFDVTDNLSMGNYRLTDLADGINDADAVNKAQVDRMIREGSGLFRGSFSTKASLNMAAWQSTDPTQPYYVDNNDYCVVLSDETQHYECWRYGYVVGSGWAPQYRINEAPMTVAQIAAINSGITADRLVSLEQFKNTAQSKLNGIEAGAQVNDIEKIRVWNSGTSEYEELPITNKTIDIPNQGGGSGVIVDPTLSISGQAADAKAAGDGITEVKNKIYKLLPIDLAEGVAITAGKYVNYSNGNITNSANRSATDYIDISAYENIVYSRIYTIQTSGYAGIAFYDSSKTYISGIRMALNADTPHYELVEAEVPENAVYIRLSQQDSLGPVSLYNAADYESKVPARLDAAETGIDENKSDIIRIDTYLEDIAKNGYFLLDQTKFALYGWQSFLSSDSRAYRVKYTEALTFDRDILILAESGYGVDGYTSTGSTLSGDLTVRLVPANTTFKVYVRAFTEDTSATADVATYAKAIKFSTALADIIKDVPTHTDISMFGRIGISGDSYAAGGGIISGVTALTWGKNLERQSGVKVDIYAKSGENIVEWITDTSKGLPALLAGDECGLYWFQHGINGTSTDSSLGTPDDMSANPHPATFYGQYVEAIEAVQTAFPSARIVLATPVWSSYALTQAASSQRAINAVKNIAEYCQVPCIEVTDDDFFRSPDYGNNMVSSHPTAMVAAGMAMAYRRLLARCILNNPTYFHSTVLTGHGDGSFDYANMTNKPQINGVTLSGNKTASDLGLGTYSKPSGGIPASDLASDVQISLGKADTALQSYTETDPTVPNWAKASSKPSYTASEVGAVAVAQGVAHAGEFVVVGSDGNITSVTLATWQGGNY